MTLTNIEGIALDCLIHFANVPAVFASLGVPYLISFIVFLCVRGQWLMKLEVL